MDYDSLCYCIKGLYFSYLKWEKKDIETLNAFAEKLTDVLINKKNSKLDKLYEKFKDYNIKHLVNNMLIVCKMINSDIDVFMMENKTKILELFTKETDTITDEIYLVSPC